MFLVLDRSGGDVVVTALPETDADQQVPPPVRVPREELGATVRSMEAQRPRWVWSDTASWYPPLLAEGVRVDRCHDLRLCRAILRGAASVPASVLASSTGSGLASASASRSGFASASTSDPWNALSAGHIDDGALFGLGDPAPDPVGEFRRQLDSVASAAEPTGLRRLLAAESAGALAAAEMHSAGLPWHRDVHERMLEQALGSRPTPGRRPPRMEELLARVQRELGTPDLNPDSPPELLKALRRAGLPAESTRSWDLRRIEHPAIGPLLEYKRLARLLSANGWHWLEANVEGGRFRPDFVPGGVVTGRWSSRGGGGALQLPRSVRGAVVADPGWTLVVADAAQLEPRILAALAGDTAMIEAGSRGDLYTGIVASGAGTTREQAKVAMLGAIYGATAGESGRLLPTLGRAFPRAMALVEEAARAGERGEVVSTRLGRSSPQGEEARYDETASAADLDRRRSAARSRGRFTRNFVVQGTAAEWALCWMAVVRARLRGIGAEGGDAVHSAGEVGLWREPHLVFFLHDELVVHTPAELAGPVERVLADAAREAGRLLFGADPGSFPVTIAVVDDYSQAK